MSISPAAGANPKPTYSFSRTWGGRRCQPWRPSVNAIECRCSSARGRRQAAAHSRARPRSNPRRDRIARSRPPHSQSTSIACLRLVSLGGVGGLLADYPEATIESSKIGPGALYSRAGAAVNLDRYDMNFPASAEAFLLIGLSPWRCRPWARCRSPADRRISWEIAENRLRPLDVPISVQQFAQEPKQSLIVRHPD